MEFGPKRRWCRAGVIRETIILAFTEQGEMVLIPRTYGRMGEVHKGDILSFIPETKHIRPPSNPSLKPIKYLGQAPILIGTRPDNYEQNCANLTAVEWKQQTEKEADLESQKS